MRKMAEAKRCYVCGTERNLHKHHVYGGTANRKLSEKYGMYAYLCGYHHNQSNKGVHFNKALSDELKQDFQLRFMDEYPDEDFMEIFKRNYL